MRSNNPTLFLIDTTAAETAAGANAYAIHDAVRWILYWLLCLCLVIEEYLIRMLLEE